MCCNVVINPVKIRISVVLSFCSCIVFFFYIFRSDLRDDDRSAERITHRRFSFEKPGDRQCKKPYGLSDFTQRLGERLEDRVVNVLHGPDVDASDADTDATLFCHGRAAFVAPVQPTPSSRSLRFAFRRLQS